MSVKEAPWIMQCFRVVVVVFLHRSLIQIMACRPLYTETLWNQCWLIAIWTLGNTWDGWGCEVSCVGHHRLRGKTTMGSDLDGAVFDIAQMLTYPVHNMSRSQFYLGFGHFGWLLSFFGQYHFGGLMIKLYFLCWNYSLSSGWHISVLGFS